MILINLTVLHSGPTVGRVLGSPKNLEITVCENNTTNLPPPRPVTQQQQQPPPFTARKPLNQDQQSYSTFGNRPPVTPPVKKEQMTTPTKSFYGAQANNKPYGNSPSYPGNSSSSPQTQLVNRNVFPINSLNPYQNKLDHYNDCVLVY